METSSNNYENQYCFYMSKFLSILKDLSILLSIPIYNE